MWHLPRDQFATRPRAACRRRQRPSQRTGRAWDRCRTTAGADRGHPPVGSPAPATRRGRPARVSDASRAHADHRVHHPSVGDRPDPHPPPRPRGPRRRTESPIDAGPREPRDVTRPAPVRRRPDRPVSTHPRGPAPPGTFGARDRPTAASPESLPAPGHPAGPQAERPARHTGAVAGAPSPAHRGSRGRGPGPTLSAPRLKFLSSD